MSCSVKLFEPNSASPPVHVTLTAPAIELVAVNEATKANLCQVETNKALNTSATSHGADLQFNQASIVYQIAISDPIGVYGGTTITSLTGSTNGDLDVVLEKAPRTRSANAGGAGTAAQARQAVLSDPFWTPGEKQAVLSLMNALGSLRGASTSAVMRFVHRYEVALENLGINYTLF
jgi:hypothetical protein